METQSVDRAAGDTQRALDNGDLEGAKNVQWPTLTRSKDFISTAEHKRSTADADKTTISGSGRKLDTKEKRKGSGMSDADFDAQYKRDQAALKRERGVTDIHGLQGDVKVTDKSLNKDKISVDELDTDKGGALAFGEDEKIRIGGTKYKRAGEYSTGTARFKEADVLGADGKPVGGKFLKTDNVKALAEDIRISQGLVGTTRNRDQYGASKGAATLGKNIGANAAKVQDALDNNEAAQKDLGDVTKALEDLQKGKGDRAETLKKIEKLKLSGGEDLTSTLGLDQVGKDVKKGGGFGGAVKSFFGINQGQEMGSLKGFGSGIKQAFGMDRIFGKADTGGKFSLAKKRSLQGSLQFEEAARREKEWESQTEASARAMSEEEGLGLLGEEEKTKKEQWEEKWIPEQNRSGVSSRDELDAEEQVEKAEKTEADRIEKVDEDLDKVQEKKADAKKERKEKSSKRTGQGGDSVQQKQLETLKEIRDILARTGGGGGGGDGTRTGGGDDGGFFSGDTMTTAAATLGGGSMLTKAKGMLGFGPKALPPPASAGALPPPKPGPGAKVAKTAGKKGLMRGALSKVGGVASKALGAAKFIPGAGLAIAAGQALYGGFNQWDKTDEFDLAEGEEATTGMKMASAAGGALSALTFGLADADAISSGIYGKTDNQTMAALEEQAPDVARLIEAKVQSGMTLEEAIADSGDMIRDAGVENRGFMERADDFLNPFNETEGLTSAKDSGLYTENFWGDSTIDEDMLGDATIEQLRAIKSDADLSPQDEMLIDKAIENRTGDSGMSFVEGGFVEGNMTADRFQERQDQKIQDILSKSPDGVENAGEAAGDAVFSEEGGKRGIISRLGSAAGDNLSDNMENKEFSLLRGFTGGGFFKGDMEAVGNASGQAIDNMTRLAGEGADMAGGPQVVNNTTNNNAPPAENKLIGVMSSPDIKNKNSTIHRAMDRRFSV